LERSKLIDPPTTFVFDTLKRPVQDIRGGQSQMMPQMVRHHDHQKSDSAGAKTVSFFPKREVAVSWKRESPTDYFSGGKVSYGPSNY
jgi:hypothetical protein